MEGVVESQLLSAIGKCIECRTGDATPRVVEEMMARFRRDADEILEDAMAESAKIEKADDVDGTVTRIDTSEEGDMIMFGRDGGSSVLKSA